MVKKPLVELGAYTLAFVVTPGLLISIWEVEVVFPKLK
jgi:hypothetical protein